MYHHIQNASALWLAALLLLYKKSFSGPFRWYFSYCRGKNLIKCLRSRTTSLIRSILNTLEKYKNSFHSCFSKENRRKEKMINKGSCGSLNLFLLSRPSMLRAKREQSSKEIHLLFVLWLRKGARGCSWDQLAMRAICQAKKSLWSQMDLARERRCQSPRQGMLFWGLCTNHLFYICCQFWQREIYLLGSNLTKMKAVNIIRNWYNNCILYVHPMFCNYVFTDCLLGVCKLPT